MRKLVIQKYHHIIGGGLGLALEYTFSKNTTWSYLSDRFPMGITEGYFNSFVYTTGEIYRLYSPAYLDIQSDKRCKVLTFIPFFSTEGALYCRICFRYKNDKPKQKQVFLAKSDDGEIVTFSEQESEESSYLSFKSLLVEGKFVFEDLYVKIVESKNVSYYRISVSFKDDDAVVTVNKVERRLAPIHLQIVK